MEPLDEPLNLNFKQGSFFPTNVKIIGYGLAGVALFSLVFLNVFGILIITLPLIIISLIILMTHYGTIVNPENKTIESYVMLMGFIKFKKIKSFEKHIYISALPSKLSTTAYANTYNSTSITNYRHMITIFGRGLRGKIEIAHFDSFSTATEKTKDLAQVMQLEYFEYDPKLVREMMSR